MSLPDAPAQLDRAINALHTAMGQVRMRVDERDAVDLPTASQAI